MPAVKHTIPNRDWPDGKGVLYVTDWGHFEIPDDVPHHFRKDGWFDRRYRCSTDKLKAYFAAQTENLRLGRTVQTFTQWEST